MQASNPAPSGTWPAAPGINRRVIAAAAVVVAVHAVLLAAAWLARETPPPAKPVESRAITAQLLAPAPAAQPVAVQSAARPAPPKPAPRTKPKIVPTPMRQTARPTPQRAEPTPAAPADTAPPAPPAPAPAASPAPARETMEVSAPKNVSSVKCSLVKPDYPAMSRRRGESGTAHVHFVVGVTGRLESIELQKSSGYARLDEAALAAMRASTCSPYVENGRPIRAAYTQPYDFGFND